MSGGLDLEKSHWSVVSGQLQEPILHLTFDIPRTLRYLSGIAASVMFAA
jgi:hypothetical protein